MLPNKDLIIYNSLTSQKEKFNTINKDMVGMYVCGPTVYNTVHLGNCRTFISFDLIFRYFKHLGFKIRYVRNITDVKWDDIAESGPAVVAMVSMPLTYSISHGIALAFIAYALIKILSGNAAKTSPAIWVVAVLSVLSFSV